MDMCVVADMFVKKMLTRSPLSAEPGFAGSGLKALGSAPMILSLFP
jgi:hypothetical protein